MRKDYSEYDASDFLGDRSFLAWLRHEDPENDLFWEKWLQQHPESAEEITLAKKHFRLLMSFETSAPDPAARQKVWEGIESGIGKQGRSKSSTVKLLKWMGVAASIILLFGAWFVYKQLQPSKHDFVIITAVNGMKKITLTDGSLVTLNKSTVLKYNPNQPKELWLKGEAYFEVKHTKPDFNADHPFIVHAGKEHITVLGTDFLVKTIEDVARVVLVRGKLRASVGSHAVTMHPGEKVEWNGTGFLTENVNAQLYLAWKDGEFHFKHTSLTELKQLVKDLYGYDLIIKDKLLVQSKTISGTVTATDKEVFWRTIALMFNANVKINGTQIILMAR